MEQVFWLALGIYIFYHTRTECAHHSGMWLLRQTGILITWSILFMARKRNSVVAGSFSNENYFHKTCDYSYFVNKDGGQQD